MAAAPASLCCVLLIGAFVSVSAGQKTITADPGQDVTLPCRAPNNNQTIIVAEWSRAELQTKHVILYRYDHLAPAIQDQGFRNRVELQDAQMKGGDVSVILKDVTTADEGIYECRVFMEGARTWKHTIIHLSVAPPEQRNIPAGPGEDVTLTCRAPNSNITAVKWSRRDLKPKNDLFYLNEQSLREYQHPSFRKRVELQDRQMKGGDASLILKDVTAADEGTYECRVFMRGTKRRKRSAGPINTIYLSVPPEQKTITAESGEDVTLPCGAPNSNIIGVEWSRADLGEKYVLLYQDGSFDPAIQDQDFKNRVDLRDRQMKDGDVSVILKDVMVDDDGTFKCHVLMEETRSWKLVSIIYLQVLPGQP